MPDEVPSAATPWQRWTLTLMRTLPPVTVEARSFEDAVAEARKQLESWVPTAQWSGHTMGSSDLRHEATDPPPLQGRP